LTKVENLEDGPDFSIVGKLNPISDLETPETMGVLDVGGLSAALWVEARVPLYFNA